MPDTTATAATLWPGVGVFLLHSLHGEAQLSVLHPGLAGGYLSLTYLCRGIMSPTAEEQPLGGRHVATV